MGWMRRVQQVSLSSIPGFLGKGQIALSAWAQHFALDTQHNTEHNTTQNTTQHRHKRNTTQHNTEHKRNTTQHNATRCNETHTSQQTTLCSTVSFLGRLCLSIWSKTLCCKQVVQKISHWKVQHSKCTHPNMCRRVCKGALHQECPCMCPSLCRSAH